MSESDLNIFIDYHHHIAMIYSLFEPLKTISIKQIFSRMEITTITFNFNV